MVEYDTILNTSNRIPNMGILFEYVCSDATNTNTNTNTNKNIVIFASIFKTMNTSWQILIDTNHGNLMSQ